MFAVVLVELVCIAVGDGGPEGKGGSESDHTFSDSLPKKLKKEIGSDIFKL